MTSVVALIPARASSKRLPGKHTKKLAGQPLIAYTIAAALKANIFDKVLVCSDAKPILQLAHEYKAESFQRMPSLDDEADIEWVKPLVTNMDPPYDAFVILRPTAPFRTAETIRWAWQMFTMAREFDSLRVVAPCQQHPAQMWTMARSGHLQTILPVLMQPGGAPWHSQPMQTLPPVYTQTTALEIAWTDTVRRTGTVAGDRVLALELTWPESLDITTEHDWWIAERALHDGRATLPELD